METFEGIRYRLLGPVELYHEGRAVDLSSTKVRLMLTALALAPNTVVSFEALGKVLWERGAPPSARSNVRTYATTLRRVLDRDSRNRLVSRGGGYQLRTDPDELDVQVFNRLADIGRRALADGEPASARTHLRQALALWRGHPAEGLPPRRALAGQLDALTEQRLLVEEDLLEAELAAGGTAELVGTARRLVTEHPLRERCWAALMLALYRGGDVAAALDAFTEARNQFVAGLGLEPGPRLQQLHQAMLNRDPALLDRPATTTATTAGAVHCELPRQVTLVNRAEEVRTVVAALCTPDDEGARVVVVYGPPGAGKSAVALRAAHQAAWCYPDGQRYVDLTATAPDGARWRSTLAGRRELVVVDHCTSAARLRPLLVAEPDCGFLITADTPLAAIDATCRVAVRRLSTPAAVAMLGKLVGRARVTPDWAAVDLVVRCDHLPLAIRAAAAVLIAEPRLGLADLAARLSAGTILDELAVDDLDPRARLLARYREMSTVDRVAAAAFQYLGTDSLPAGRLSPAVARRLADHGLLEDGRLAPLTHEVAVELGTGPA
ncbi:BTAD domain-containing putative transcriptional regulator [Actinophytocola sp.]|uniref:AfsR/SARP family transcriptional regulator n=1 Tax=Actinophytocola sp. TaxID=1872138 RepID=UPI003D6C3C62